MALDIVVFFLSKRIVRADQDLIPPQLDSADSFKLDAGLSHILPTTRQLDSSQLLLVVLLECRASFLDKSWLVFGQGSDVCTV